MKIALSEFNIAESTFVSKVLSDLNYGVNLKAVAGVDEGSVSRVWTDTKNWQFSVLGVIKQDIIKIEKLQIQSFGMSIKYLQLNGFKEESNLSLEIEKLSSAFAELSDVMREEADAFLQGYMNSTFNRSLTEELFKSLANDKEYLNWLIL